MLASFLLPVLAQEAPKTLPEDKHKQLYQNVCGSCHDSDAAQAHISVQVSPSGYESCTTCHEQNGEWAVKLMHKAR